MKIKLKKLDKKISSNILLAAFSLVIALLLWSFVVGNRNEEIVKTYEIRLDFLNPPSDLALFPSARSVIVTLNGERRVMNSLQGSNLVSEVDLRGLTEGRHTLPVRFRVPARTAVAQIVPREIEVELARMIDKDLKVRVLPPENLPDGYIMDGAVVTPEMVKARGRADQLSGIYEITVRPTVEELLSGGSWRLPLKSPSDIDLEFSPLDVTVSATYYQGMPRKELPIEVRTRGTLPANVRLLSMNVIPTSLPVEGRAEAFEQVTQLTTDPINLSRISKSTSVQTRIAELPSGLTLLSSSVVTVNIELRTLNDTREFSAVPIMVQGLANSDEWQVVPSTVRVFVEGLSSALQNLNLEDLGLTAYVDLSNIVVSSLRLPVRLNYRTMAGIESVSVEPQTVKVTRRAQ